jgi:hypothetical protein
LEGVNGSARDAPMETRVSEFRTANRQNEE